MSITKTITQNLSVFLPIVWNQQSLSRSRSVYERSGLFMKHLVLHSLYTVEPRHWLKSYASRNTIRIQKVQEVIFFLHFCLDKSVRMWKLCAGYYTIFIMNGTRHTRNWAKKQKLPTANVMLILVTKIWIGKTEEKCFSKYGLTLKSVLPKYLKYNKGAYKSDFDFFGLKLASLQMRFPLLSSRSSLKKHQIKLFAILL